MRATWGRALPVCLAAVARAVVADPIRDFDVSFSTPPHAVGSVPAVGTGPGLVSAVISGNPKVRASFGLLQDQPLVFDMGDNRTLPRRTYDQIRFDLPIRAGWWGHHIEFDLVKEATIPGGRWTQFSIFIGSRKIVLSGDSVLSPAQHDPRWPFTPGSILHFTIDMSFESHEWSATMQHGGGIADLGAYRIYEDQDTFLEAVRFSLGYTNSWLPWPEPSGGAVGLDNLVIESFRQVPEPGGLLLCAAGALLLRFRRGGRGIPRRP